MKWKKRKLLGLLSSGLMVMALTGCASQISSAGIEVRPGSALFCSEAQPITFDRLADTAETIAQIKEHNAVGQKLCGWAAQ